MSKIIYLLIANNTSASPVAEISFATGNHSMMALKLIQKLQNDQNTSKSYAYENRYMFHYHNQRGVSLLCMCDSEFSNRLAYQFLFEIRDKIIDSCGDSFSQIIGFGLKKHLVEEIKQTMTNYNNYKEEDKLAIVNKNINEVKDIMIQNIDKIIERGEKIELLVSKTDQLQSNAVMFNRQARSVKRFFLCKNYKITLIVALILIAVIFIVITLICGGFNYSKCQ